MRITALFFASYRELAGTESLELQLPEGATAAAAVEALRRRNGLSGLPPRPAVAVNLEFARLDAVLRDGDELALLPPVAGG